MTSGFFTDDDYFKVVFDNLPTSLFVVNCDFKILNLNPAAKELFGIASDVILQRLCGQIVHCLHAIESEGGCGSTAFCPDCVIRNAVESSCKGEFVKKSKYKMKIQQGNDVSDVWMIVSTSPLNYKDEKFVLLAIEDITEIIELKRLLPICSNCSKIRNDEQYWESVSDYFKKHEGFEFTHSVCPECARKLYPDFNLT